MFDALTVPMASSIAIANRHRYPICTQSRLVKIRGIPEAAFLPGPDLHLSALLRAAATRSSDAPSTPILAQYCAQSTPHLPPRRESTRHHDCHRPAALPLPRWPSPPPASRHPAAPRPCRAAPTSRLPHGVAHAPARAGSRCQACHRAHPHPPSQAPPARDAAAPSAAHAHVAAPVRRRSPPALLRGTCRGSEIREPHVWKPLRGQAGPRRCASPTTLLRRKAVSRTRPGRCVRPCGVLCCRCRW
jgi:hypothetical protein